MQMQEKPSLIRFLARNRRPVFAATVVVFLIGTFVGLGGYLLTDYDKTSSVADVAGDKIPRQQFDVHLRNALDRFRTQNQDVTPELENRVKQEVLRDLIVERLFAKEAEKLGLVVTDKELADDIRETFQREGRFDQQLYFQTVQSQFRTTPEQYEDMRRRSLLAFKYRQLVQRGVKVTPQEVREAYVKENKGSDKDFDKKKDEALARLQQRRALEALNYLLRQLAANTEIKSYLQ